MARLQVHLFADLQKFSLKLGTSEPAYRLLPGTHHLLTTAFQRTLPDVDTRETLSFWISIKTDSNSGKGSLWKQLTFGNANTGFPAKWGLRNESRNSILMTQIWVVLLIGWIKFPTQHDQYGISALVSQMSFDGETSGSIAKHRLFSQAMEKGFLST